MRGPVVVDASVLVIAFADGSSAGTAVRDRLWGTVRHAPHLVDAEVGNVLRRMLLRGDITRTEAEGSRILARTAVRHAHTGPIGKQAWALRAGLTFYDAIYVAVAKLLDAPLLTADGRLANAPGPRCRIEVLGNSKGQAPR